MRAIKTHPGHLKYGSGMCFYKKRLGLSKEFDTMGLIVMGDGCIMGIEQ